jgi:biopolymer transport protein TolR
MKFPRNARILRGHLDATPYAMVFFLLVLFVLLGSLVYTPGVKLSLPVADELPGTDEPAIAVAIDANGRFYFENQVVERAALADRLRTAARSARQSLTLIVQADKAVPYDNIIQLAVLARDAGIHDVLLATLPRVIASPPAAKPSS